MHHATKKCSDNLLTKEMKRTQILMNKHVCLGLPMLEISNLRVFIYFLETEIWRESKIKLHGYRQLYNLRKSRRHLRIHCKRL